MGDTGKPKPPPFRRVGDETRQRIDDLASGWSLDKDADEPPDEGDTERVEKPDLASATPPPRPPGRPKTPSSPPPTPPRVKAPSVPPPLPKPKLPAKPPTITPTLERNDDTSADADETILQIDAPGVTRSTSGMRAREIKTVPRERGVLGDVQYVFRAVFGVAQARRELAENKTELGHQERERDERLIAVARHVVGDEAATWPSVENGRDALAEVEEKRSRHAGAVAAADEEIAGLERARRAAHDAYVAEDGKLDTELKAIETKLAPVEKRAAAVRKQVLALKSAAGALAKKVSAEERKLVSVNKKSDPAAVEAHLASVRAEREGVLGEEPALAAELDELDPNIANLTAARLAAQQKREAAREREQTEATRTAEKILATEARRGVERNAVDDTDRERDAALLALGERLDIDRPEGIADKLRGADEHAVAIATLERVQIELAELVEGVDRTAFARGVLWLALALGAVVAIVLLLVLRG